MFELIQGDCFEILSTQKENHYDSVVTDPPYGLSFMGKDWDYGIPGIKFWKEILRVSKPGAHLLAFGGTRTFHRLTCAIEDAGWEIRDCVMWVYGSGFPKSLDVSKAIDKAAGAEREILGMSPNWRESKRDREKNGSMEVRGDNAGLLTGGPITNDAKQWDGWGTALKPAWEPIILARKPLIGTVVKNVLEHGTGAINIDGCRVSIESPQDSTVRVRGDSTDTQTNWKSVNRSLVGGSDTGRWPANLIHDGSEEVVGLFPEKDGRIGMTGKTGQENSIYGKFNQSLLTCPGKMDSGSAARFFLLRQSQ